MTVKQGDQSFSKKINIPEMKWIETPSFVTKGKGDVRNPSMVNRLQCRVARQLGRT